MLNRAHWMRDRSEENGDHWKNKSLFFNFIVNLQHDCLGAYVSGSQYIIKGLVVVDLTIRVSSVAVDGGGVVEVVEVSVI